MNFVTVGANFYVISKMLAVLRPEWQPHKPKVNGGLQLLCM